MAPARKKPTASSNGITKMPTAKQRDKMKADDAGFAMAKQDAVKFLQSRKQAVYNIARTYHLDPDELFQEGFEVLLTCVRDYAPVYEKADGTFITVQFTTFFGSRMDSKGKELRNTNPEYQARQAMVSDMSDDDKKHFRENPPLLVQHLDHENPMQEMLRGEASSTKDDARNDASLKWAQDGFFDQKLTELVAREQDEKKRTILMQIKMGGVFNFQEMAYHFGVTDSRASQLLNELMDAFYIQRMIDGTVESVIYDFKKLKFNEKRILRLVQSALGHASSARQVELQTDFHKAYPELAMTEDTPTPALETTKAEASAAKPHTPKPAPQTPNITALHSKPKPLADVLTEKEQQKCPKLGAEQRNITSLTILPEDFRPPAAQTATQHTLSPYVYNMAEQPELYPIMVTEEGLVIDGARRLQALQENGKTKAHCIVYHAPEEKDANILRIGVNIRRMDADKIDLYWAIVALANLGLSQQKIADALGTSRTNVIVYAKVKDKASLPLRQLFEDGLIQITNASACVEFSEKVQERAANFIRTFGANWGKGAQFTELFEAAKNSKLTQLEKKTAAQHTVVNTMPATPSAVAGAPTSTSTIAVATDTQTKERLHAYETALRDAEAWTAQRESVINRQTEDITAARSEIEILKKELEAAELTKYGDESSVKEALKELKSFISLTERMAAATLNAMQATKAMRPLKLTRSQLVEVQELLDTLDQHTNALRLEVSNKAKLKPKVTRTTEDITL